MKRTVKQKLSVLLLVLCYCTGCILNPIYADFDNGLSDLLQHRENSDITKANEAKISIDDFRDVKESDWFYKNLDFLVSGGLINGKTKNTFEPGGSFSYAECSAIIVRYLGLQQEANDRQAQIVKRNDAFKNIWYAGYFEVLADLGLFLDYGIFELEDDRISSIDTALANSPIERYRFAESITKSFETSGDIKAKNVFFEYGGCGREFIAGGMYKEDILSQYAEKIADFEDIPKESRQDILKAYYNGIFAGDISGNFYPHNNLTRAEMAKVLSCICDFSLRSRLIDDGYGEIVTEDMLHTDSIGVKTLDYDTWTAILEKEAEAVTSGGGSVEYAPSGNAPFGYAIDAYFYTPHQDGYRLFAEWSLKSRKSGKLTLDGGNFKVLLVIRNVTEGSRPEGVYQILIDDGVISSAGPNIRQA